MRTKLVFLAFALVVLLPIVQGNYAGRFPNRATASFAIAEAGPGYPANMKVAPRHGGTAADPSRSTIATSGSAVFGTGMMALARSFMMWMGL